ncbi:neurofilament heavy polypeptide [Zeugodacus cucurbitae]|uniref:neurofilament heavy polypeptide n=1 Tax=Zeugodacus cucurbitae TaxID=28588 RepID=UPI0023D8FCB1|nr:neurofilament heavy polypeptide [Zeugodacus cucurbitae]
MSEVANNSEIQQSTVPVEQTIVETGETVSTSAPTSTEAEEISTAAEKQVVNNSIEAECASGDAGTSAAEAAKPTESSPKVESKKTPAKRTPSKRMSFIERAQKESEELVKNMGGSLELDGGRRTRSSTRGTPTRASAASTPPPAKKARTSPANASSTPSRARGRGRKIEISEDSEETKEVAEPKATKTPEKSKSPKKKQASSNKVNNALKESSEPDTELSAPEEVAEKSTENKEEESVQSSSSVEQSEDQTDAKTETETISEDKQNKEQNVVPTEVEQDLSAEPNDSETPMDTSEPISSEEPIATTPTSEANVPEEPADVEIVPVEITESTNVEGTVAVPKDVPCEAMEVDSNSKSSDVELIESTPSVIPPTTNEKDSSAPLVESQTSQEVVTEEEKSTIEEPAKDNEVESEVDAKAEDTPQAPVACDVGSVEPNADTLPEKNDVCANNVKEDVAAEKPATVEIENSEIEANANNDEGVKPENELCVPKVVSPSITNANSDGTVATIL